ncbi:hypothetical protein LP421_28825 [Rhizobium sp. RCAM05350]|nr:hypothetical protein LP421_28825 [Rhizobium sp. RCAM05350]
MYPEVAFQVVHLPRQLRLAGCRHFRGAANTAAAGDRDEALQSRQADRGCGVRAVTCREGEKQPDGFVRSRKVCHPALRLQRRHQIAAFAPDKRHCDGSFEAFQGCADACSRTAARLRSPADSAFFQDRVDKGKRGDVHRRS